VDIDSFQILLPKLPKKSRHLLPLLRLLILKLLVSWVHKRAWIDSA
jgi:hypothetical protein